MNKTIDAGARAYSLFERAFSSLQSPLLLAVRLYWGWQFFQTGLGKLMHIPKVVGFFTVWGYRYRRSTHTSSVRLNLWAEPYCFWALGLESSHYR